MKDKEKYDFIVIGSGIGGLVTSVILAKNGYRVLVLEKNHQIGGALQVFSRDKCVFDTGVHYLGGLDKGENLHRIFDYLGVLQSLKLKSLNRDCFDLIRLPSGKLIKHGQGFDTFERQLCDAFPEEKEAIHSFCEKIHEVCDYFPLYNMRIEGEHTYYNSPEILQLGAWDFVCSLTKNDELRTALLGSGPLYAGDRHTTPFYVVALIMNSYIKGSYRLVDGGSQLASALVKQLRKHGGQILKRKEVIAATYQDDKRVHSIECRDGSTYSADHFISGMHPSETIRVFGKEHFRPAFRNRIENLENTVSAFMLYASLKEESIPYLNHNLYLHFSSDNWETRAYNKEEWPGVLYVCTPASSRHPDYAESICVMTYMKIDEVKEWAQTHNTVVRPGNRGNGYDDFKRAKEELILKKLEEHFPTIRSAIKGIYSSTPLTYRDYLAAPEGTLYGIMKNYKHTEETVVNTRTKIPNLYLTGQNIIFHGILGATIGAFVTSFNFVDIKTIVSKLNENES